MTIAEGTGLSLTERSEFSEDANLDFSDDLSAERAAKRVKINGQTGAVADGASGASRGRPCSRDRTHKYEYLIDVAAAGRPPPSTIDDEAESRGAHETSGLRNGDARDLRDKPGKKGKKQKGQNIERTFGRFEDAIPLCNSRATYPEFSPAACRFGDRCKLSHDLRKYLKERRREDLEVFEGKCPVFEKYRSCPSGWKCRFHKSHMNEVTRKDGKKELVLIDESVNINAGDPIELNGKADDQAVHDGHEEKRAGVHNTVSMANKIELSRKRLDFRKADEYITWMNKESEAVNEMSHRRKNEMAEEAKDAGANFVDPPFMPSEKRRLYFGPETPVLAPLTTQGNLPFRRLCIELGCQFTYSEMAMSLPLLQGSRSDWTLMKAHDVEVAPPTINPQEKQFVFDNYDRARDLRFGAQISGNQPWMVTKAADALNRFCPRLRLIDLNCGCPIDMIFKSGAGSALLESPGKLERMIRGMNALSGEIPITAKIRTGVKSNRPTATALVSRLAFGGREHRARLGAPGCAAVTLHGRSREQRYTKKADWAYIGECAAMIRDYHDEKDALTDTVREADERTLSNAKHGRIYFLGNGDCYSHADYLSHVERARVDSVMLGRSALIKPWIFEEIAAGQYLDKTAGERLGYVERFARYGLEAWGSDELGVGFTRRFLLEWLSFTHRYVPVGLLERLPPNLNDRPPAYRGRDELETLLASENYKDWIKITEMFLGPTHPGFQFQPKHRSNAWEAEG